MAYLVYTSLSDPYLTLFMCFFNELGRPKSSVRHFLNKISVSVIYPLLIKIRAMVKIAHNLPIEMVMFHCHLWCPKGTCHCFSLISHEVPWRQAAYPMLVSSSQEGAHPERLTRLRGDHVRRYTYATLVIYIPCVYTTLYLYLMYSIELYHLLNQLGATGKYRVKSVLL